MDPNISAQPAVEIDYPESDGKPMGETDVHVLELMAALATLRDFYRDEKNVYVAGNNFIYYEEGEPSSVFSPDVYVVFGVPKRQRRTYKLWLENNVSPTVVFEFTSRKTRVEDKGTKKGICEMLGVAEYYLCDPEMAYLKPPLQGYRLENDEYKLIRPNADGFISSPALGLKLKLDKSGHLRFHKKSGTTLYSPDEIYERERAAQLENEKLKAEIERLKKGSKNK